MIEFVKVEEPRGTSMCTVHLELRVVLSRFNSIIGEGNRFYSVSTLLRYRILDLDNTFIALLSSVAEGPTVLSMEIPTLQGWIVIWVIIIAIHRYFCADGLVEVNALKLAGACLVQDA